MNPVAPDLYAISTKARRHLEPALALTALHLDANRLRPEEVVLLAGYWTCGSAGSTSA